MAALTSRATALLVLALILPHVVAETPPDDRPGEAHKALARMEGDWRVRARHYEPGRGAPVETEGQATNRVILGGRFLRSELETRSKTTRFAGFILDGYDRVEDKRISVWADGDHTAFISFAGDCRDEGRRCSLTASTPDGEARLDIGIKSRTMYTVTRSLVDAEGVRHVQLELLFTRRDARADESDPPPASGN